LHKGGGYDSTSREEAINGGIFTIAGGLIALLSAIKGQTKCY